MGTIKQTGFTIIETMLFLAITGLMVVALLAGSSAAINQQRYRDSTNTLVSVLQQQYTNVLNVTNSRADNSNCAPGGISTVQNNGSSRGTTGCSIVGKYLAVDPSKPGQFAIQDVYATADTTGFTTDKNIKNDLVALDSSRLVVNANIQPDTYRMEWGTKLGTVTVGDPQGPSQTTTGQVYILIVRSPYSGAILTFVQASPAPRDVATFVKNVAASSTNVRLCVDPDGLALNRNAVDIAARSSSTSGVTFVGDNSGC